MLPVDKVVPLSVSEPVIVIDPVNTRVSIFEVKTVAPELPDIANEPVMVTAWLRLPTLDAVVAAEALVEYDAVPSKLPDRLPVIPLNTFKEPDTCELLSAIIPFLAMNS